MIKALACFAVAYGITAIKAVRARISGCGLKDAKDMVDKFHAALR